MEAVALSGVLKPATNLKLSEAQREKLLSNLREQIRDFSGSQRLMVMPAMDFEESSFNPWLKARGRWHRENIFKP